MTCKRSVFALLMAVSGSTALCLLSGCASSAVSPTPSLTPTATSTITTPGGPGGGAVINSDSIVAAQIKAIRQQTSGYPWELDVLIQRSTDVGSLPNPTKDSVGKVITVKTDLDVASYKVNDTISARVKYVGDVPKPGITLYIYEIVKS